MQYILVNKVQKNTTMLYPRLWLKVLPSVFIALWLHAHVTLAVRDAYRRGHDGATVSRMLARLGEGTAHFETCTEGECQVEGY